jgi:hypothetical protein
MDRKEFLKVTAKGAVVGFMLPCCAGQAATEAAKCAEPAASCDAAFLRDWLSEFVPREESTLGRVAVVKLLEERGRACCRSLEFRQKLIRDSNGSLERLVELMGKIVGPENCRLEGKTVTLIYPRDKCGCGWNPQRAIAPDDPYCECSKSNNKYLFEIVTGKKVQARVTESPRRGQSHCKFIIQIG